MLSEDQQARFSTGIRLFNFVVYPIALSVWAWVLLSVRATANDLKAGRNVTDEKRLQAQRRIVNFPWWLVATAAPAWLLTIPVLLMAVSSSPDALDINVYTDLPVSVVISGLMAVTHGMFAAEILSQHLLFPIVFAHGVPNEIPGAYPLSLKGRGALWTVSSVIFPIISVLLLAVVAHEPGEEQPQFVIAVGVIGILFAAVTSWMMGHLVGEPVDALRVASRKVAGGDLSTRVDTLRADEFGPLITNFNSMVAGLREKQHMQEQFGRHVGEEAAARIMAQDPGLAGTEQVITVMFADLRNFTARSEETLPHETVMVLNMFFTEMVNIVEQQYQGMVDKFLGDGFMALFGAGHPDSDHATHAVQAGRDMLTALVDLNERLQGQDIPALELGVGIHTGPAVVGSIGSQSRGDFTAIGNTVNVAARVESLTKSVDRPLLLTDATRDALTESIELETLPPQSVKGVTEPVPVFALRDLGEAPS